MNALGPSCLLDHGCLDHDSYRKNACIGKSAISWQLQFIESGGRHKVKVNLETVSCWELYQIDARIIQD